jgi:serine/threonine protein phosphatase PrpC
MYGEDVLAEAELLLPASVGGGGAAIEGGREEAPAPKWVRAMGVFDGHGMHGKEAARVAAERYIDDMRRTTMQTLGGLLAGDVQKVRKVEFERYRMMESHLEKELRSPTGGTTATTVQFLACGGKVWGVVSNVGDSPVLLVENGTGRVKVLTGRHSWDNPEERQKYLERCWGLGVVPREVVYGRINCGGMRMTDARGGEEPLMMYREGTSEVCVETREWLCKQVEKRFRNSIGGSQSMRRMVLEKLKEGPKEGGGEEWEVFKAMEEHAHVNWGATILVNGEGKIQMSRSLGDSQEKKTAYIWAEPDVSIFELGPGEDW